MADFPAGRWRARWIWADAFAGGHGDVPGRHVVALRRVVELDAVPASAPARIFAVTRYALWVNAAEVARGPVRANPRRQPYDVVDLAPHLVSGQNVIAILAWRYDAPTPWSMPAPYANDLGNGAVVMETRLGDEWLVTDDTWQADVLTGWTASTGEGVSGRGRELLDARSLPADWLTSTQPLDWPPALERSAFTTGEPGRREPPSYPYGPVTARTLSWPTVKDVALSGSGSAFATGRVVVGTVVVDAEGPAGASVVMQAAELLDAEGQPAPNEHDASIAVVTDGTRRLMESVDAYGLRGVVVTADDGVIVHGVTVRERLHPVTGDAFFECSDPVLNEIWAVGRRTVSICSLDAYLDCPTREQRAWTGDSVVHQMVDLTTNDDWTLARWHPRLAASPRADGMLPMAVAGEIEALDFTVIPDWALHWVHSVWNVYRYTGDREEIASLLQVAEGVLRWFEPYCDDAGCPSDVPGWVIIDWSSVYTEGVSSALCGLWGRGLLELAQMADWLGDGHRAGWARSAHSRLAAGFERLWDAGRERYVDSMVGGFQRPMASQHGQAAAIVGGLAPADRHERLVEVLIDESRLVHATFSVPDGPAAPNSDASVGGAYLRAGHPQPWWDVETQIVRAQPFFRYVVHDALAAAGRADLVAGLCLDWNGALERSATSWTETWFGGTTCHGWSSTPTRDLMTRVLGVTPAEPGFTVAAISPALGDLDWAKGVVPTPHGPISIKVTKDGVVVDSPVPIHFEGANYPAGRHDL